MGNRLAVSRVSRLFPPRLWELPLAYKGVAGRVRRHGETSSTVQFFHSRCTLRSRTRRWWEITSRTVAFLHSDTLIIPQLVAATLRQTPSIPLDPFHLSTLEDPARVSRFLSPNAIPFSCDLHSLIGLQRDTQYRPIRAHHVTVLPITCHKLIARDCLTVQFSRASSAVARRGSGRGETKKREKRKRLTEVLDQTEHDTADVQLSFYP